MTVGVVEFKTFSFPLYDALQGAIQGTTFRYVGAPYPTVVGHASTTVSVPDFLADPGFCVGDFVWARFEPLRSVVQGTVLGISDRGSATIQLTYGLPWLPKDRPSVAFSRVALEKPSLLDRLAHRFEDPFRRGFRPRFSKRRLALVLYFERVPSRRFPVGVEQRPTSVRGR